MSLVANSAPDVLSLLAPLAARLTAVDEDPFVSETIVVPSSGVRDFLVEALLTSDLIETPQSIVANIKFMYPNEFVFWAAGKRDAVASPWTVESVRWEILSVLRDSPSGLLAPRFNESRRQLRYATRLAEIFDRYCAHRPEMLFDWGRDSVEGTDPVLVDDAYLWQFTVWAELRRRLGPSPAEEIVAGLRGFEARSGVGRITLVGLHTLSPTLVAAVEALSVNADVAIFALSPAGWTTVERMPSPPVRRREVKIGSPTNSLASQWGQINLESLAILAQVVEPVRLAGRVYPNTLLGRLQSDISNDVQPEGSRSTDPKTDGSIQVHLCHGEARQVEVLRDAVLHLMKGDPTLTLRDVVVLCPDPDRFGPLIEPIFGAVGVRAVVNDATGGPRSILGLVFESVAAVLGGHCTARQLLDLAALDPVAGKFGLSADELLEIEEFVPQLDIRWGLDESDRERAGFADSYAVGTWRHAVDRVIASIFLRLDDDRMIAGDVVPFTPRDIQVAQSFTKLDALLRTLLRVAAPLAHSTDQPVEFWAEFVSILLNDLIDLEQIDRREVEALTDLGRQIGAMAKRLPHLTLELPDVLDALLRTAGNNSRASSQWVDAIRVGSLRRFGAVPARVIAILGMDEDSLSTGGNEGDNLLSADPHLADHDSRDEERSQFLMALMSATDALLILANGRSVTTNKEVSRAQPLEELIGLVERYSVVEGATPTRPLVRQHPRQSFDAANFVPAGAGVTPAAGDENPWSFNEHDLRIFCATKAASDRADLMHMVLGEQDEQVGPLEADLPVCSLRDLVRGVARPADVFVRDRLEIQLPVLGDDNVSESLELWPIGLVQAGAGRAALEAALSGEDISDWWARFRSTNVMPTGKLGEIFFSSLRDEVTMMIDKAGVAGLTPDVVPVEINLGVVRLVGSVPTRGDMITDINYSRYHPEARVAPLISLAALTLAQPEVAWRARIVRRGEPQKGTGLSSSERETFRLAGDSASERSSAARAVLDFAVRCRRHALRAPVLRFRRASWTLVDGAATAVVRDLERDLASSAEKWVFGSQDVASLLSCAPGPLDTGIRSDKPAAVGHALAVAEWWNKHVELLDTPSTKKRRRTSVDTGDNDGTST